ncbi:MAG: methyltransferase domain-containing protein [Halolamina sp.]
MLQRDGAWERAHPIEEFYFGEFEPEPGHPLTEWLGGPLLTVGCGAGQHELGLQRARDVVATDVDANLVAVARDRGVDDVREADMFDLPARFERGRLRSVLSYGTQAGLAGSMDDLRRLFADLAYVTDGAATAVVDFFDPTRVDRPDDMLGYRADPAPGLARRVMTFAYEGDVSDVLSFRLFAPVRVHEAAAATRWELRRTLHRGASPHFIALLAKPDAAVGPATEIRWHDDADKN